MKKVNQHLIHAMMIVMALALAVTMFSMLLYQFKRSKEDLVILSANHAGIVIQTIIIGIQTTAGIRKHLNQENVATNIISKVLKEYGTGALIQKFEKASPIFYIACQDEDQIIVATKGVNELSSIWGDPFLGKAFTEEKIVHRFLPGKKYYFETVKSFRVDGKKYLLRVCFKARYIRRLELHLIRRLILQAAVFLFIIAVLVLYFINVHSNQILAREHDNMMEKVGKMTQQLRQQERIAAMGRLAAGIAHEIRNPLNAIQILVQRMEREITPNEAEKNKFKEFTRIIREEIKRLNEIVKQFLEFSSTRQPNFSNCNPGKIANDIVLLESGVANQKNISISLNIEKNILEIEADALQLKQALVNVIKNAIEAMNNGGEINISVFQKNKNTHFIIEDNGEGMSEEKLEKAFDLYYSTKDHGTGLGLAITRRIVDAHNGEISISKREPQGIIVTIIIPNRRKSEHIDN